MSDNKLIWVLQSRKFWSAVIGLVAIFYTAYQSGGNVDPDTLVNAIMGIVAAYMGATALEDAEVCAIPYTHLVEIAAGNSSLQQVMSRMMSREILREHSLMMLLGSMNAEERLAAFLLNLSHRLKVRGYSASEFHLRMSRAEIGSYLGMTLETVSRTFSAFQQLRLLEVDKRHIRLVDLEGLRQAYSKYACVKGESRQEQGA